MKRIFALFVLCSVPQLQSTNLSSKHDPNANFPAKFPEDTLFRLAKEFTEKDKVIKRFVEKECYIEHISLDNVQRWSSNYASEDCRNLLLWLREVYGYDEQYRAERARRNR